MKKIISLILILTLLCSIGITALATNNVTVGGKITLTQFIGTNRDNANSVQLYIKGQLYTVDTKAFYDIADSMIITSNIEPYTITNDGIYICVKADEDNAEFVYLSAAGIINGKEQKKTGIIFAPYDLITREEAATILNRIAVYLGMDMPQIIDAVYYWDESNISDWAIDAVKTMRQFGIMEGVNGYEFYPKGTYTVEQAIATMVRLYDKIKLEWEATFNYSDFNKANHGEGENFQRNSGIEYISGKAVKTIYDDYTLTGDNLNHLSWAKIGYDDYYGGLYLGISMIAHHLIADDEFSSLCSEMVTNMYDGTSVKDNADFANDHFTISINGTPVKIKAVGMGKGNGHHDYYFALDTDINRYDINEIDFECKL